MIPHSDLEIDRAINGWVGTVRLLELEDDSFAATLFFIDAVVASAGAAFTDDARPIDRFAVFPHPKSNCHRVESKGGGVGYRDLVIRAVEPQRAALFSTCPDSPI